MINAIGEEYYDELIIDTFRSQEIWYGVPIDSKS